MHAYTRGHALAYSAAHGKEEIIEKILAVPFF
jgi:hypothetical protein